MKELNIFREFLNKKNTDEEDREFETMVEEIEEMEKELEKINGKSDIFISLVDYLSDDREGVKRVHAALKKVMKKMAGGKSLNEEKEYYPGYKGVDITGVVDGDTATLNWIGVSIFDRGKGLGKAAVTNFEEWAREQGATYVEVEVYQRDVGFWEKMGYSMVKENPPPKALYDTEYTYGKKIA